MKILKTVGIGVAGLVLAGLGFLWLCILRRSDCSPSFGSTHLRLRARRHGWELGLAGSRLAHARGGIG